MFKLGACLALWPMAASSQIACASVDVFREMLTTDYGEFLVASGSAAPIIIEWWANPETLSWTLVAVRPDEVACLLNSGNQFSVGQLPPAGDPL